MIGWVHYDDDGRNQTELARRYLQTYKRLRFEPGRQAAYSNLNYMIIGAVIEAVSGKSYESYVRDRLLRPLGMHHTDIVYTPALREREAAGSLPAALRAPSALLAGRSRACPRAPGPPPLAAPHVPGCDPSVGVDRIGAGRSSPAAGVSTGIAPTDLRSEVLICVSDFADGTSSAVFALSGFTRWAEGICRKVRRQAAESDDGVVVH